MRLRRIDGPLIFIKKIPYHRDTEFFIVSINYFFNLFIKYIVFYDRFGLMIGDFAYMAI